MIYYYDIEQEKYISRDELQNIFNQLKTENPSEYDYSFSHFIMNCSTLHNGSLQTIYQRKQNLEKLYFSIAMDEYETGLDNTSESESIKKEIDFVNKLIKGE